MEPKDYFNKPIIGQLVTRKIDKLNLRDDPNAEYIQSFIDVEKKYDVIDIIQINGDTVYVTNTWIDETSKSVEIIHTNFVKRFYKRKD